MIGLTLCHLNQWIEQNLQSLQIHWGFHLLSAPWKPQKTHRKNSQESGKFPDPVGFLGPRFPLSGLALLGLGVARVETKLVWVSAHTSFECSLRLQEKKTPVLSQNLFCSSLSILKQSGHRYTVGEERELLRRKFVLLMYLMRSPCYDKYTK